MDFSSRGKVRETSVQHFASQSRLCLPPRLGRCVSFLSGIRRRRGSLQANQPIGLLLGSASSSAEENRKFRAKRWNLSVCHLFKLVKILILTKGGGSRPGKEGWK